MNSFVSVFKDKATNRLVRLSSKEDSPLYEDRVRLFETRCEDKEHYELVHSMTYVTEEDFYIADLRLLERMLFSLEEEHREYKRTHDVNSREAMLYEEDILKEQAKLMRRIGRRYERLVYKEIFLDDEVAVVCNIYWKNRLVNND